MNDDNDDDDDDDDDDDADDKYDKYDDDKDDMDATSSAIIDIRGSWMFGRSWRRSTENSSNC